MKQKLIGLSQRYATGLRKHLEQGSHANLQAALPLGRLAVALGLETLELARIHERALTLLKPSSLKHGMIKRARVFFAKANSLIEATHRAAQQSKINLSRLSNTLGHRTEELAASKRAQKKDVVQRKVMKDAFTKSGKEHHKTLAESLQLQNHLRLLTHQALAAEEDGRRKISCDLRNEIAQTLLGINVRLLALKKVARSDTAGLKNEITSTQRLVANSARSVRRFARELDAHHPE